MKIFSLLPRQSGPWLCKDKNSQFFSAYAIDIGHQAHAKQGKVDAMFFVELFTELSSLNQEMVRAGQAPSPGFQIGGRGTTFSQWLEQLALNLDGSNVPSDNPGKGQKVGGNGVYPGGLNLNTYSSLLNKNPIFYTTSN